MPVFFIQLFNLKKYNTIHKTYESASMYDVMLIKLSRIKMEMFWLRQRFSTLAKYDNHLGTI